MLDLLLSEYSNIDYVLSLPYQIGVGLITKCAENRRDKEIREMWLVEMSLLPFLDEEARKNFPKSFIEYKQQSLNKSRKSTASKEEILEKAMRIEQKRGELNARDIQAVR